MLIYGVTSIHQWFAAGGGGACRKLNIELSLQIEIDVLF